MLLLYLHVARRCLLPLLLYWFVRQVLIHTIDQLLITDQFCDLFFAVALFAALLEPHLLWPLAAYFYDLHR